MSRQKAASLLLPVAERSLGDLLGTPVALPPMFKPDDAFHASLARPLRQLSLQELRQFIKLRIGLAFVVPRALAHLREHPLAETMFMPGDLLTQVLRLPDEWWRANADLAGDALAAVEHAIPRLQKRGAVPELEATLEARATFLREVARAG